jgi:hypothetical protein
MAYCTECGTEVSGVGSYCPERGAKLEEQAESGEQPEPQDSEPKETAPCQKCDTDISVEADRCPNCGYEPGSGGILSSIFAIICIPWVGAGILFFITLFYAAFTGAYTLGNFLIALVLIPAFFAFPAVYLYGIYAKRSCVGDCGNINQHPHLSSLNDH